MDAQSTQSSIFDLRKSTSRSIKGKDPVIVPRKRSTAESETVVDNTNLSRPIKKSRIEDEKNVDITVVDDIVDNGVKENIRHDSKEMHDNNDKILKISLLKTQITKLMAQNEQLQIENAEITSKLDQKMLPSSSVMSVISSNDVIPEVVNEIRSNLGTIASMASDIQTRLGLIENNHMEAMHDIIGSMHGHNKNADRLAHVENNIDKILQILTEQNVMKPVVKRLVVPATLTINKKSPIESNVVITPPTSTQTPTPIPSQAHDVENTTIIPSGLNVDQSSTEDIAGSKPSSQSNEEDTTIVSAPAQKARVPLRRKA